MDGLLFLCGMVEVMAVIIWASVVFALALAAWGVDVLIRRRRVAAGKSEMRDHLNNWRNIL